MDDLIINPGWGRDVMPRELVNRGCLLGAEIGVQRGEYSEALLSAGVRFLFLVDLWAKQPPGYFDIANVPDLEHFANLKLTLKRMERFPFQTHALIGKSDEKAAPVKDGSLDFIYLDADHSYEATTRDLNTWVPKVRPGGIIAGHDFLDSENCCGSRFGVESAVKDFCRSMEVKELFVAQGEPFPNWHFVKV